MEGIFRVPGSQNRINELAAMYEVGGDEADAISLEQESTHDVGGLFKLFLRRLPEPLCTFELYSTFVDLQGRPPRHPRTAAHAQRLTNVQKGT